MTPFQEKQWAGMSPSIRLEFGRSYDARIKNWTRINDSGNRVNCLSDPHAGDVWRVGNPDLGPLIFAIVDVREKTATALDCAGLFGVRELHLLAESIRLFDGELLSVNYLHAVFPVRFPGEAYKSDECRREEKLMQTAYLFRVIDEVREWQT